MATNSASLADEITLDFSRACLDLAEALSRQREKDTPDRRATVADCQAAIDSLLDMYLETAHPELTGKLASAAGPLGRRPRRAARTP